MKLFFYTILFALKSIYASEFTLDDLREPRSQFQAFSYNFQSYSCPNAISLAILSAVNNAIYSGRLPVIVCDMDDTLVKISHSHLVPTKFYHRLIKSGVLPQAHGVVLLTARPITTENILTETSEELEACTPGFTKYMYDSKNLGGLVAQDLPHEKRFLHDHGLLIMGNGGLTKRQTLDIYFQNILVDENQNYELIFVDNSFGWFPEFCNDSGYDSKIVKGHFFHYNSDVGEMTRDLSSFNTFDRLIMLSSWVPSTWNYGDHSDEDDEDDLCDLISLFKKCLPCLFSNNASC